MQYVPSGVYFARVRHKGKLFRKSLFRRKSLETAPTLTTASYQNRETHFLASIRSESEPRVVLLSWKGIRVVA